MDGATYVCVNFLHNEDHYCLIRKCTVNKIGWLQYFADVKICLKMNVWISVCVVFIWDNSHSTLDVLSKKSAAVNVIIDETRGLILNHINLAFSGNNRYEHFRNLFYSRKQVSNIQLAWIIDNWGRLFMYSLTSSFLIIQSLLEAWIRISSLIVRKGS